MKDISFKAMLAGATAGMSLSFMLGFVVLFVAQIAFALSGESPPSFNERMHESAPYLVAALVAGSVGDVFAGFIGGFVGRASPMKNGIVSAIFAVVLSIPMLPTMIEQHAPWFMITSFVIVVPGAWLGVRLSMWLAPKKQTATQ